MTPPLTRRLLVAAVYLASLAAAGWCAFHVDWYCCGTPYFPPDAPQYRWWTMGRPVPWLAGWQTANGDSGGSADNNLAVPVALGLLGLGVPATAHGGRRRLGRLGRVTVVAGLAGLGAAAADVETGNAGLAHGSPAARLDRLFGDFVPGAPGIVFYPPCRGDPMPIRASAAYIWLQTHSPACRERLGIDRRWPTAGGQSVLYPYWKLVTALTAWAMLCAGGAAAAWWKPWRPTATTPPAG
jgi:hypothetical protein